MAVFRYADTARVETLAEGLALWRATPLAALSGDWVAHVRAKWHRRRLEGLRLDPLEEIDTTMTLIAGDEGDFVVDAFQTDQQNVDFGGGQFDITVE